MLDISKPLRRVQRIKNKAGQIMLIDYKYERLPFFCFLCGFMGHNEKIVLSWMRSIVKRSWVGVFGSRRHPVRANLDIERRTNKQIIHRREGEQGEEGGGDSEASSESAMSPLNIKGSELLTFSLGRGENNEKCEVNGRGNKWEWRTNQKEVDKSGERRTRKVEEQGSVGAKKRGWENVDMECLVEEDQVDCVSIGRSNIVFSLVSYSQNHIHGDVRNQGGVEWRFVGIYGWPESSNKRRTWELLYTLCDTGGLPLLVGGDFNEVLSEWEREGGAELERPGMVDFRECMEVNHLHDLGFRGQWFTWERGKQPSTCKRERLDLFLANEKWAKLYPNAQVEHMLRYKSDYTPILVRLDGLRKHGKERRRGLKFETSRLMSEECGKVIRNVGRARKVSI
ncbi:Helicase SEN1 [Bienertia sinuspersici]